MRRSLLSVIDAVWPSIDPTIPAPATHPLGCHRPRVDDPVVLERLLFRVVMGCSYEDAAVTGCSATTLRSRRDEWLAAGVFEQLWAGVLVAYDQVIGLVLDDISIDGCIVKSPCGGEVSGKSPVNRGKRGTKRSIAVDGRGVPLAVVCAPANVNDHLLLGATLDHLEVLDLPETPSLHLDRGYDIKATRAMVEDRGYDLLVAEKKTSMRVRSRQRWVVERTNSWHNNFGQLRRCTDRVRACVELSMLLANVVIVVRRMLARAYRYSVA